MNEMIISPQKNLRDFQLILLKTFAYDYPMEAFLIKKTLGMVSYGPG
tara:strand:- start:303 stop:443 length:141 start_codon:yes stop_codon:yes gene_type:complete